MRIYLTGFMGSGKSTVGPLLAEQLGYRFLDLDDLIEAEVGKSIETLFTTAGEVAFRDVEARILRQTAHYNPAVIALGGGALTFEHNLQWALAQGLVVYLRASADTLLHRLRPALATRPLLCGGDGQPMQGEVLRLRIETLLAQREPFYQRAHLTIEVDGCSVQEIAAAVRAALPQPPPR
jgi:shikimate kinase